MVIWAFYSAYFLPFARRCCEPVWNVQDDTLQVVTFHSRDTYVYFDFNDWTIFCHLHLSFVSNSQAQSSQVQIGLVVVSTMYFASTQYFLRLFLSPEITGVLGELRWPELFCSTRMKSSGVMFQEYSVQLLFREKWFDERLKFNNMNGQMRQFLSKVNLNMVVSQVRSQFAEFYFCSCNRMFLRARCSLRHCTALIYDDLLR